MTVTSRLSGQKNSCGLRSSFGNYKTIRESTVMFLVNSFCRNRRHIGMPFTALLTKCWTRFRYEHFSPLGRLRQTRLARIHVTIWRRQERSVNVRSASAYVLNLCPVIGYRSQPIVVSYFIRPAADQSLCITLSLHLVCYGTVYPVCLLPETERRVAVNDPGYMSKTILKFQTDKFNAWNKRKFCFVWLVPSRLRELHESKLSFVSHIRSKL